jgi:hypothetical protein
LPASVAFSRFTKVAEASRADSSRPKLVVATASGAEQEIRWADLIRFEGDKIAEYVGSST